MMNNKVENLEGIVSKLKQQGINAGEEEKARIINEALEQAKKIVTKAQSLSNEIINEAKSKASQIEKNSQAAIAQASRDMIEATKVAILNYMKSVFGKQSEKLFTQKQYLEALLKAVVESIPGNKTIMLPAETINEMEAFLLSQSLKEQIELKPLAENDTKIVINNSDKEGLQFVLSAKDVEDGLFSLLNKDLVKRITQKKEE